MKKIFVLFIAAVFLLFTRISLVSAACGPDQQSCTKCETTQDCKSIGGVLYCTTDKICEENQCCDVVVWPDGTKCCFDTCTGSDCDTCHIGESGCNPPTGGGGGGSCGNGNCGGSESCSSCPADCGGCPTGTARGRGVIISSAGTCADVNASTNYLSETLVLPGGSPSSQNVSGGSYATWSNLPTGSYTIFDIPPANYLLKRACWGKTPTGSSGEGLSTSLAANETLTWNLGYSLGNAWVQAQGGDVYGSGSLGSLTPPTASPRLFNLDGTGGDPGVVTYGNAYDFAIETTGADPNGATFVSTENWLVNETYTTVNYYDTFYRRFGSPTTADYDCSAVPCSVNEPAARTTPYYVVGNMTTQGNWNVGAGETLIFIVNGNLTIDGGINITGKGFVAFIVNGNITVTSSVGSNANNSTNPDIEGIYMTSPTGTFSTGASTVAGKARLVVKGTVVAASFLLQRDLDQAGGDNTTTSSELFIYNPLLLVTMPDVMKETKVTWQEVAP